jgi:hypothetical protein
MESWPLYWPSVRWWLPLVGALCGAIAARFFSRRFLYAVWAVLAGARGVFCCPSLALTDLDRVEANVLVFWLCCRFSSAAY